MAIGPRTWFGDRYGANVSRSGTVTGNTFTGAFSYAIAITSAQNFTVQDNTLFGNTSFIGARGPNCSESDTVPTPAAFILDTHTTKSLSIQSNFEGIQDGDSLTCVLPPNGGDFWPFASELLLSNPSGAPTPTNPPRHRAASGGGVAGIVIGCILGFIAATVVAWFSRRWMLECRKARKDWNICKPLPTDRPLILHC
jgi:parallel beta-helix repeat protein